MPCINQKAKQGEKLSVKDYGALPSQYQVEAKIEQLERHYSRSRNPSLIRSLFSVFYSKLSLCLIVVTLFG